MRIMPGRSVDGTQTMFAYATPALRFMPCWGAVPAWQPESAQVLETMCWVSWAKQAPPVHPPVAATQGGVEAAGWPFWSRRGTAHAHATAATTSEVMPRE